MSEGSTIRAASKNSFAIVEYTPQAYFGWADPNLFFAILSLALSVRPELTSIDDGLVQTEEIAFGVDIESNFDIDAMTSVGPGQPVRLHRAGDIVKSSTPNLSGFNKSLDALDGSYCTEDPYVDETYPDPAPGGYQGQR
jgi:tripeptidyl-peptidase-1